MLRILLTSRAARAIVGAPEEPLMAGIPAARRAEILRLNLAGRSVPLIAQLTKTPVAVVKKVLADASITEPPAPDRPLTFRDGCRADTRLKRF